MSNIHPTAIIDPQAVIGPDNAIGPHVVIEGGVTLGRGNRIWANAYLCRGTTIGDGNEIHMGAVIGHAPQDLAYQPGTPTFTTIGHRNTIREYVTIHRGTKEGSATVIGDDNFFMANAHIAHNCQVGNKVILVNLASLTGYCVVEDGAFLSGIVGLHQFTRVGRLAMISALSAVNKDVPPYTLCGGRPAVVQGLNAVGMRRAGITPAARQAIKQAYRIVYRSGLNVSQALTQLAALPATPEVRHFTAFIQASERGICDGLAGGEGDEEPSGETLLPKKGWCPNLKEKK